MPTLDQKYLPFSPTEDRIEQFYPNAIVIDSFCGYPKLKQIAQQIAKFHKVKPLNHSSNCGMNNEGIWPMIHLWHENAMDYKAKDFGGDMIRFAKYEQLDWSNVQKQIKWMQQLLPSMSVIDHRQNAVSVMEFYYGNNAKQLMKSDRKLQIELIVRSFLYERVLCHNDVCCVCTCDVHLFCFHCLQIYVGNVLELKENGKIKLIDFEYTTMNYRGCDFASLFSHCGRHQFTASKVLSAEERREFLERYLLEFERFERGKYAQSEWRYLLKCADCVMIEFCLLNCYLWVC